MAYYRLLLGSTLTPKQTETEIVRHGEYPPTFFAEADHWPTYTGRAVLDFLGYRDQRSVWDGSARY